MAKLLELRKPSVKKNDTVQIISGREKGKTGKVLRVFPKNHRVLVEKLNMKKRHTRPTQQSPSGGIIEKESALHISAVLLFCPKCNKGVRIGRKMGAASESGKKKTKGAASEKKVRYCKKCQSILD